MLNKRNITLSALLSAILFVSSPALCQLNKGQWLAGIEAGYSHSKQTGGVYGIEINNSVQALPDVGYFIADKFCVGIRGGFSNSAVKQYPYNSTSGTTGAYYELQKANTVTAGFFTRYYFLAKTNKINILADAAWFYNSVANTSTAGADPGGAASVPAGYFYNSKSTSQFGSLSFSGGLAWFVSPKISLELMGIVSTQKTVGGQLQTTGLSGVTGLLGINIHFGKKHK